ncbi:lipase maturation factor 2-like [Pollicipes pollicipes]|uniref:lipase maturation factor 2-like n=1 Tax=Pollicipes pollicipes TaxID=41117 RepID=UPI00188587C2|nr:lipase maturation factor 2-like [Pollicipes pollicipes]
MLLVRWLLFRLTFASGMLKLLGGGPAWWGLTALETLFENHWLPTPLSWVAHQLPAPALRTVLVAVLVAQIAVPVLFFAPVRQLRLFAFWTQVALQVAAMLTGNCSFYHILVIVLCLSLVDDDWLQGRRQAGAGVPGLLATLATLVVYGALLLGAVFLFELRLDYGGLAARTAFTKSDFEEFAQKAVPGSIALGAAAFLLAAAEALTSALMDSPGLCSALDAIWKTLVSVAVAALVFGVSLVPFSSLDAATQGALPTLLRDVAGPLQQHRLLGQYGLFHELAGAGGRRELILEGAHSASGPWKEIEFKYKPGDVAAAPSFASPHQPRLDWQMSLAAAGKLSDNPWMSALAYRLLTGQAEVIRLLDVKRYPFVAKPPKYVRAMKHGYKFTGWKGGDGSWWSRSDIRQDYLPVYTAQDKALLELLTSRKIIGHPEQVKEDSWLVGLLEQLRRFFDHWEPARLVWAVLLACWAVDLTRGRPWYR